MGLIKNFIIAYDDNMLEGGVGEGTSPENEIEPSVNESGILTNPSTTQAVIDDIKEALGLDANKPLGIGFKSKYQGFVYDDVNDVSVPKNIDAEAKVLNLYIFQKILHKTQVRLDQKL